MYLFVECEMGIQKNTRCILLDPSWNQTRKTKFWINIRQNLIQADSQQPILDKKNPLLGGFCFLK